MSRPDPLAADRAEEIYITQHSPKVAERVALRLVNATDTLERRAERGRAIAGRRELSSVRPYLVRYRMDAERCLSSKPVTAPASRTPEGGGVALVLRWRGR